VVASPHRYPDRVSGRAGHQRRRGRGRRPPAPAPRRALEVAAAHRRLPRPPCARHLSA